MRYANENGYTINDDFKKKDFKAFREDAESIYLNESELEKLYTLELPDQSSTGKRWLSNKLLYRT